MITIPSGETGVSIPIREDRTYVQMPALPPAATLTPPPSVSAPLPAYTPPEQAKQIIAQASPAGNALVASGAQPEEVQAMTPSEQRAAADVLQAPKSNVAPIIGAVVGFLVGGPIGAAAGGAAGLAFSKKKA